MPFRNLSIQTNSNKDSGNYSCNCRFVAIIVRPNWRTITVGLGDFCHSNNLFLWKAENVLGKQRFVCHPVHREQSICHRVGGMATRQAILLHRHRVYCFLAAAWQRLVEIQLTWHAKVPWRLVYISLSIALVIMQCAFIHILHQCEL